MSESSWSTRKYRAKNWKECNQALKARGSLTVWFEPDMQRPPPASGNRGRRQKDLDVDVHVRYTHSSGGLHVLIDSTGMKFLGEGEWKIKKHGAGLGYCNGAASSIGIGIDTSEGNFARRSPISEPSYCKTGPTETRSVQLSVIPLPSMVDYHITLFEGPTGGALTRHLVGDYIGALPEQFSIGLAGSTGDATQVNEVRMLHVTKPIDVSVTTTAPILNGRTASHTITLQNKQLDEGEAIPITKESDAPLLSQTTDPNLTNIRWTCVAAGEETTCPRPSGTGPFENLGSYLLGRSGTLTFTVTGTVACGANSVQVHSATAVFPPESEYDDAYPLDNYDTASGLITTDNCDTPPPTATAVPFLDHLALVLLGLMAAGLGAIGLRRRSTQSTR